LAGADYRGSVREYDEADIRAAFTAALGTGLGDDPVARDLQAPDGLATQVALELARTTIGQTTPTWERDVAEGATACLCGLLVSAWLPPAEPALSEHLLDGIATVRSFGRHAVIARQCDLNAVASAENELGRVVADGRAPAASTLQLFELGFAIGLGARPERAAA
jgi:hypothetical protein